MPTFKTLILLGRPASGKSEFIDFIKQTPLKVRKEKFYIGDFIELDDFVWLWEKFVEDDLWEKAGKKRLFSKREEPAYLVTEGSVLDFCLARFNHEIAKRKQAQETVFIEFSRGSADGGYRHALSLLTDEILKDAAILFIYTSYEESVRRNEARYQEKLKNTVLAHKVPEEDMIRFGKEIDWLSLTQQKPSGTVLVRELQVPFVTMTNEPEYKPAETEKLQARYGTALHQLMNLYATGRQNV